MASNSAGGGTGGWRFNSRKLSAMGHPMAKNLHAEDAARVPKHAGIFKQEIARGGAVEFQLRGHLLAAKGSVYQQRAIVRDDALANHP